MVSRKMTTDVCSPHLKHENRGLSLKLKGGKFIPTRRELFFTRCIASSLTCGFLREVGRPARFKKRLDIGMDYKNRASVIVNGETWEEMLNVTLMY